MSYVPSRISSSWIARPHPNPDARVRLFCLPYAGGGAQTFQTWAGDLPAFVQVCSINLPGRGRRFTEPPAVRLLSLVEEMAVGIRPFLDRPFAICGHSMGALIAFELACRLRRELGVEPVHLFVSGSLAPGVLNRHPFHTLSDDEFLAEVRRLNGLQPEILHDPDMMAVLLPILRADFTLSETYCPAGEAPLNCALSVFGGADDPLVEPGLLDGWRVHTTGECQIDVLPGDHFFLHTAQRRLTTLITERLRTAPAA